MKNQIALSDSDGTVRFFEEADLSAQLLAAGLLGDGAAKSAAKNLATAVRQMRQDQKRGNAKQSEQRVDALLGAFFQAIEKL